MRSQVLVEELNEFGGGIFVQVGKKRAAPNEVEAPGYRQFAEVRVGRHGPGGKSFAAEFEAAFVEFGYGDVSFGKPRPQEAEYSSVTAWEIENRLDRAGSSVLLQGALNAAQGAEAGGKIMFCVERNVHLVIAMNVERDFRKQSFLVAGEVLI
jgi:hypothetical protein